MKINKNILWLFLSVFALTACDPEDGDKPNMGGVPSANDIQYTADLVANDPNSVKFSFLNEKASPYWSLTTSDGSILSKNDREFTYKYIWAGEYPAEIRMYNKGGLSEAKSFTIQIAQNDPSIYKDPNYVNLTGGETPKTWIWDSGTQGHLGCGEATGNEPNWWSATPNELSTKEIYDDELSFALTREAEYGLVTHGKIYVNEGAAQTMAPNEYPNGSSVAIIADYTQPAGQTWSFSEENGKLFIKFSKGAFPSYVANPSALGGKYEVLTLTKNTLYLKWSGDGINWYYRFKAKG